MASLPIPRFIKAQAILEALYAGFTTELVTTAKVVTGEATWMHSE